MYTLYHSRKEKIIEVKKAKKALQGLDYKDHVTAHNDYYYICSKRSLLVEKAKEIKAEWIAEAQEELKSLEAIEIK